MTGFYLAEFSVRRSPPPSPDPTDSVSPFQISYKPVRHGRPGIGATHSSRFVRTPRLPRPERELTSSTPADPPQVGDSSCVFGDEGWEHCVWRRSGYSRRCYDHASKLELRRDMSRLL